MKCPKCSNNQKFSEGMICGKCQYRFALSPKDPPNLSDMALAKAVEQLSGPDTLYFTFNQLYVRLYRLLRKKGRSGKWGLGIGVLVVCGVVGFLAGGIGAVATVPVGLLMLWWIVRRPIKIDHVKLAAAVRKYHAMHPIAHLVDGRRFENAPKTDFPDEFKGYAPERILIVQHNDMADMLLLNRFHFDNKCLIVSKGKYPAGAFAACQHFLKAHPDLPVQVAHDVSNSGLKMKEALVKDPSWHLAGRSVQDIGIHLTDAEKLKSPVWIPQIGKTAAGRGAGARLKSAESYVEKGFKLPVDTVPPRAMMGALTIAATTGMALLSAELLAEQRRQGQSGAGYDSGGYG